MNTNDFAVENFDGDFVLFNILTGDYFEVSEKSATLFRGLLDGICPIETVEKLREVDATAANEAWAFIQSLEAANVLTIEDTSVAATVSIEATIGLLAGAGKFIFEGFADLSEMIAADPVHDVDLVTGQMVMAKIEPDIQ